MPVSENRLHTVYTSTYKWQAGLSSDNGLCLGVSPDPIAEGDIVRVKTLHQIELAIVYKVRRQVRATDTITLYSALVQCDDEAIMHYITRRTASAIITQSPYIH